MDSLYDVGLTESSQLVPDDLGLYLKLCEEGRFYDELMALDDNQTDRETFKKQIFTQVFYGKNCYEGRLTRLFARSARPSGKQSKDQGGGLKTPLPPHAQAGVRGRDQPGGSAMRPRRDLGRDDP